MAIPSVIERGVSNSLIGLHSFSRCDTVSSFPGHGKLSALKLLIENKKFQDAFARFGHQWTVPDDRFDILGPQEFTCRLYSLRSTTGDVNDLRYEFITAKKGAVASGELPPCIDCICLHVRYVWLVDNGNLTVQWMSGSPVSDMVLNFMFCNCKRDWQGSSCQCVSNGLKSTDACFLKHCFNIQEDEDLEQDSGED